MSKAPNQTELLSAAAIAEQAIPYGSASKKDGGRIYFLLRQGQVVYVGQTIQQAVQRVSMHNKDKEFDSWHWIPCPIESLAETERAYIAALKPTLNKQLNGRPLTNAELQARWRERARERRLLDDEVIQFVLTLHPDRIPPRAALEAMQQRIRDTRQMEAA
jgi:hypothetical protein